ncbi:hypothetical protein At1D1108_12130 [Agrobacterium tumefaciens]|nr:hypothetical protein At1D1108_12130 [Agrobacterium tumefaciens]
MISCRNISFITIPVAVLALAGCSSGDDRPTQADVAKVAGVESFTTLDCKKTNDGKPGYLCFYKSPQLNAYAAEIRIEKGWFGWNRISN